MPGLVCDPVVGLVEVPRVVCNASAAAIVNASAQIVLSDISAVIPVDECIEAIGEIGQSMETTLQRNRTRRTGSHSYRQGDCGKNSY